MSSVVLASFSTSGPSGTIAVAHRLGVQLAAGDLLVLTGDLGAGKTHFAKGIATGLGIEEPVTSPTFALHQQYEGRELLHHLDVYRLEDLAETLDLDLPELLESGVTIIEWGDTITAVLPENRLTVRLEMSDTDDERLIAFEVLPNCVELWSDRVAAAIAGATS